MPVIMPVAVHATPSHNESVQAFAMPATAYVTCYDPLNDKCRFQSGFMSITTLPFDQYAEKELGYPINVVGISFDAYNRRLVIYARKK